MTNVHVLAVCAGAVGVFSLSCTSVPGSGRLTSESRTVDNFTKISVSGGVHLSVTEGALTALELSGDDDVLPLVNTSVVNGLLVIAPSAKFATSPSQPTVVRVTVPKVEEIKAFGSARATVASMSGNTVTLEANDASKVDVTTLTAANAKVAATRGSVIAANGMQGTSSLSLVANSGSTLNFQQLPASTVTVDASDGSCVTTTARADIRGSARGRSIVEVSGAPSHRELQTTEDSTAAFSQTAVDPSCASAAGIKARCTDDACALDESVGLPRG